MEHVEQMLAKRLKAARELNRLLNELAKAYHRVLLIDDVIEHLVTLGVKKSVAQSLWLHRTDERIVDSFVLRGLDDRKVNLDYWFDVPPRKTISRLIKRQNDKIMVSITSMLDELQHDAQQ